MSQIHPESKILPFEVLSVKNLHFRSNIYDTAPTIQLLIEATNSISYTEYFMSATVLAVACTRREELNIYGSTQGSLASNFSTSNRVPYCSSKLHTHMHTHSEWCQLLRTAAVSLSNRINGCAYLFIAMIRK